MGRNIVLRGPGTDVTMRKTEVLDMEEKDKYQAARDLLDSLDERCRNGEKLPEEEFLEGFEAMVTLYGSERWEGSGEPENMEAE